MDAGEEGEEKKKKKVKRRPDRRTKPRLSGKGQFRDDRKDTDNGNWGCNATGYRRNSFRWVDVNEGKMRLLSEKRAEGEEAKCEARSE